MEAIIITKDEYTNIIGVLNEIKTKLIENAIAPKETFVDNQELLKKMGISKRTAQKWRDEGVIAFSQVGNKIYYKLSDVEDLLKKHHRSSFNKSFRPR